MDMLDAVVYGGDGPGPSKEENFSEEGKKAAAEEILKAVHSADSGALASALHSFVEQCYETQDEDMD